MANTNDEFDRAAAELVASCDNPEYDFLQERFTSVLDELAESGDLNFGSDYSLGDKALETRVRLILKDMGFSARKGRRSYEDIVVDVPEFAKPSIPLVIEVKSGNKPPGRAALRELDDWVFELSGESRNRGLGVENQGQNRNWVSKGAIQATPFAPAPQKGVLIYSIRRKEAYDDPLHSQNQPHFNDVEFAKARSFCIVSLPCLLSWMYECETSPSGAQDFWRTVQSCSGILPHSEATK
jgi:hypothetical protein